MKYTKHLMIFASAGFLSWVSVTLARTSQDKIDYATQIQPIFDQSCAVAGCHAGAAPRRGMSLEAGKSYEAIVGIASGEAPEVMRIKPSDAENSYLYRKLEGEQAALGGSGSQMPLGGDPIPAEQLKLIEDWINQGALKEPVSSAVEGTTWGMVKSLVQ